MYKKMKEGEKKETEQKRMQRREGGDKRVIINKEY